MAGRRAGSRGQALVGALLLLSGMGFTCSEGSHGTGGNYALLPTPGLPRHQLAAAIPVPGGFVNAIGGNLVVPRVDVSIDTRLGTQEVGAVYNSQSMSWVWSFDLRYNGVEFVDATGAAHSAMLAGEGLPIPGTVWVRLDARRIQSAGGLVHEFGPDGRLETVRWASRDYPRLEYVSELVAGQPRTVRVRQCRTSGACADVYSIAYDAGGFVQAITDRAGRRAEFLHSADGNLLRARDPLDVEMGWPGRVYAYEGPGRLVAATSSEGERIEYEIALVTRRVESVRQVGPPDRVHRFSYGCDTPLGAITAPDAWTQHVDPMGHQTVYRYDRRRRLHITEQPGGERIRRGWNGFELRYLVQADGTELRWEHPTPDEVVRVEPSGNRVHIRFCLSGCENREDPFRRAVKEISDDVGPIETRSFDRGRLVSIENGEGEETRLGYDSENMIDELTAPDGRTIRLSDYGEHGHAETVVIGGETEHRSYDAVGNLVSRSGLNAHDVRPGGEVARRFDGDRNPVEIELVDAPLTGAPASSRVEIAWRSDRRPTRIERPGGGDHEFGYDVHGHLVEVRERVDGAWQATRHEVDALGRTTAVELPNGMRRETRYDANGQVDRVRSLRDGALEHEALLWWIGGRLRAVVDAAHPAPEIHFWDGAGRLASIAFPGGESLELGYDRRGRPVSETYRMPDGSALRTLRRGFDRADRPTWLRDGGTLVLEHVRETGRLTETRHSSGLVRAYAYDPVSGRLTATTATHPARGVVEATEVALEAAAPPGALELAASTATSGTVSAATAEHAWLGGGAEAGPRVLGWSAGAAADALAYDASSNLTWSQGGARRHVYNAEGNRLERLEEAATGAAVATYESDAAGYVTSRSGMAIAWTAHGRPAAVGADTFVWDALGRPLRRVAGGVERRFRFGGRVETDAGGVPTRLDLGEVVLELDLGERRFRHLDFRGNVKLVTDEAGDVLAHYAYEPYGGFSRLGESDDAVTFAGGRAVAGLVLLGPRLLDPLAGRFLAPDPLLQLVSQFTYTQGNPIGWWDPGGFAAAPVGMGMDRIESGMIKFAIGSALVVGGVSLMLHPPNPISYAVGTMLTGLGASQMASGLGEMVQGVVEERRAAAATAPSGPPSAPGSPGGPPAQAPPSPATNYQTTSVSTPSTAPRVEGDWYAPCAACDATPGPGIGAIPGGVGGLPLGGYWGGFGW